MSTHRFIPCLVFIILIVAVAGCGISQRSLPAQVNDNDDANTMPIISKETTYITEPLMPDGKQVDYFAAWEKELYTPEMRTDENGYRLIVAALGAFPCNSSATTDELSPEEAIYERQIREKLGLDPDLKPRLSYRADPYDVLEAYADLQEDLDYKERDELERRIQMPWTDDDLPMLVDWINESDAALDLVAEAVKKPTFIIPLVRADESTPLWQVMQGGRATEGSTISFMMSLRAYARGFQVRANYRIGTGNIDGAIDDIVAIKRLGRQCIQQRTIISRLFGIALDGLAEVVGIGGSPEHPPTEVQLERLMLEMDRVQPQQLPLENAFLAERFEQLDELQYVAWNDCESDDQQYDIQHWGNIKSYGCDWNVAMQSVNHFYDATLGISNTPWKAPPLPDSEEDIEHLSPKELGRLISMVFVGEGCFDSPIEGTRRNQCLAQIYCITLAILLYEKQHGCLPPAYTVDDDGRSLHSWRVLLLPYLGQQEFFDKIRLDEPWDSEHNRQFHDAAVPFYQCPTANLPPGVTNYSVIVQDDLPSTGELQYGPHGPEELLVVERGGHTCWMDPGNEITVTDILAQEQRINRASGEKQPSMNDGDNTALIGIGSLHPGGLNVGYRHGGASFLSETVSDEEFFPMLGIVVREEETKEPAIRKVNPSSEDEYSDGEYEEYSE